MWHRIAELPTSCSNRRSFSSLLLLAALFCQLFLSACASSRAVLYGSMVPDSLADASKREFVAASLQSAKGEYREAVVRYGRLLSAQPSNAAIHYALSKAWVGLGVLDSARIYSEKSVLLNPRNKYYLGFLAALSHQLRDYGRAIELYRRLAAFEPGNAEPLSALAIEYIAADQPEKAIAVFQEMLTLDPKNETTLVQMLLIEIKLDHYQDAIGTLKKLIEQGDGKEQLRLTLGELYLQSKQYDLASKTFKELLRENQGSVPAWLALFEVSVQSGNNVAFLGDLNRFFNTNQVTFPQEIELAKLFLVRASRESSFLDPAIVMIGEIIRRHPGNGKLYALRGIAQMQKEDAAAALIDFKKAVLLDPGSIEVWEEFVTAALIKKEFLLAAEALHKAKIRFPAKNFRLKVLEGELFFQTGKLKKAAFLLEKVVQSKMAQKEKNLYLQACSTLALCYDTLGFREKSVHLYEIILGLEPDNVVMMNNLAYVLAVQGKELQRAKGLALKVVAREPSNAGYLDTLGWVLFRMGEYEEARKVLEKAAELDPREAEIADHLGKVYEQLGNREKAFEMKEKARKLKVIP